MLAEDREIRMDLSMAPHTSHAGTPIMLGTLALRNDFVAEWCLGLSLLKYQMLRHLLIVPEAGGVTLRLHLEPRLMKKYKTSRGYITEQHGQILLALSPRELEVWLVFSLGVYRSGVGGFAHVDFNTSTSDRGLPYDSFHLALTAP